MAHASAGVDAQRDSREEKRQPGGFHQPMENERCGGTTLGVCHFENLS